MFREFKEVTEINEVKGNLWKKAEKEALTEAQLLAIVRENIKREELLETDEIKKAIWNAKNDTEIAEIRSKLWNEFDFKMSIYNFNNGVRTFNEKDVPEGNPFIRKIDFIDYQGEVYRFYLLLKRLNSKQDVKDLLDEIVYCYRALTQCEYDKNL
nr:MAG TPA: phosphoprotein [Caudoviricetes sp.]